MVDSTPHAYYKKVPLTNCTQFVSVELSFGSELC